MLRRHATQTAGLLFVAALAVAGCGGGTSTGSQSGGGGTGGGTIVVAYQPQDINSQGIAKTLFTKYKNYTIEYKDFSSGADVYRAMQSGAVDFGLIGNAPYTIAISKGSDYKATWLYDVGTTGEALVVRQGKGINTVKDLKGQKIAVPFGSTADYMVRGTLEAAGLKPNDVKLINLAPAAMQAAWQRGDIDAAYIFNPVLDQLVAMNGTVIATDQDLSQKGYLAADLGVVKASLLKSDPDLVNAWMKANVDAVNMIKNDPPKAVEVSSKAYGVDAKTIQSAFDGYQLPTKDQVLAPNMLPAVGKGLYTIAQLLKEEGLVGSVGPSTTYEQAVDATVLQRLP